MTLSEYIIKYRSERGVSQRQFAKICDLSNSYISMLEAGKNTHTGAPIKPTIESLHKIAKGMGISLDELLSSVDSFTVQVNTDFDPYEYGLIPMKDMKKIPRLGRIPCGEPNQMEQNIEGYDDSPDGITADYTLLCEGDSMINANIFDGDIVYIRLQPEVENGEIAAVWVDGSTTLKRFYRDGDFVTLMPENPKYRPQIYTAAQLADLRIIGKAVGFTRIF